MQELPEYKNAQKATKRILPTKPKHKYEKKIKPIAYGNHKIRYRP